MVPVVDLTRRGRALAARFAQAAQRIAVEGSYLLGSETAAFEAEFAAWLGADQAVAVSSGASALQLALTALDLRPGDEVIVPAMTAVPTATAVLAAGAVPVPVDIDEHTAAIDADEIQRARTERTRAVIVVHLYGRPADLPETDLPIIEDAAQAHGAIPSHDRSVAVAYSFYPTKNLGGIGDGGAVVTSDAGLAQRVRRLRAHGMTAEYVHTEASQNFRMSEIEAAWLRLALGGLRDGNARRQHIAAYYRMEAPRLNWQAPHMDHVYHLCVMRARERDHTRETLADLGVATGVHYPLALTEQPALATFARHPCPRAKRWAAQCVSVPCFPELTDAEVEQVGAALAKVAT